MGKLVKLGIKNYISQNYLLYLFIILFLIMGIIFGVIGTKALTSEQLSNLNQYIDTGLETISKDFDYQKTAFHAIWRNLKTILKIWFLGLTVIGVPLILVIVFTRGFVLGFTVGFFLQNKSWQGLGLIFLTIFPQNILHLPALVIAGVSATSFSLYLLHRKNDNRTIFQYFLRYSFIMTILAIVLTVAGLIEGYLIPLVAKFINIK